MAADVQRAPVEAQALLDDVPRVAALARHFGANMTISDYLAAAEELRQRFSTHSPDPSAESPLPTPLRGPAFDTGAATQLSLSVENSVPPSALPAAERDAATLQPIMLSMQGTAPVWRPHPSK